MIDREQASAALDDINEMVQRVRQSRIYQISSVVIIMWGVVLVLAYIANYTWPRQGNTIWTIANLTGLVISVAIGVITNARSGIQPFPIRSLLYWRRWGSELRRARRGAHTPRRGYGRARHL